jgi:uncharacterized cupin superfamily protein
MLPPMSDRHPSVIHESEVAWADRGNGKKFTVRAKRLGAAAGAKKLGCGLFELPPGGRSFPFHYHLANEEGLFVLEGGGTLRLGEKEVPIRAGDYVAMPVGPAHAHQLINTSSAPLKYLAISTMQEPEVAIYPDSRKAGMLGGSASVDASGQPLRQVVQLADSVGYFDGEE